MKMKKQGNPSWLIAVIGGCLLFANGKRPYNSVLDETKVPVVRTAYTGAAAAVPIV